MEEFLNTQNGAKWCKIDKWPCWNIQPLLKLLLAFCCDCFNDWQGFVWSGNHRQEVDTEKQNQNQQRLSNEKTWCCIRRIRQGRFWCKHWAPGCCGTDLLSHSWSRFVGQIIFKYDNDTNIMLGMYVWTTWKPICRRKRIFIMIPIADKTNHYKSKCLNI